MVTREHHFLRGNLTCRTRGFLSSWPARHVHGSIGFGLFNITARQPPGKRTSGRHARKLRGGASSRYREGVVNDRDVRTFGIPQMDDPRPWARSHREIPKGGGGFTLRGPVVFRPTREIFPSPTAKPHPPIWSPPATRAPSRKNAGGWDSRALIHHRRPVGAAKG